MSTVQRFAIRRALWGRPILWLFGGTASRSYAEIGAEALRIRFGWLFDKSIPLAAIEGVQPSRWPWYWGLGWRTNLVGRIGLVGSYSGIVDIALRRRRLVWLLILPLPCKRLTVSLEDPDGFVAALSSRLTQEESRN